MEGQNTTNWSVALGGTYQIGNDVLTLAGSYLSLSQATTALQSTQFNVPGFLYTAPVPYTMADLRAAYTANFGRISLTPAFAYSQLRFSNLQLFGVNGFVPPPAGGRVRARHSGPAGLSQPRSLRRQHHRPLRVRAGARPGCRAA